MSSKLKRCMMELHNRVFNKSIVILLILLNTGLTLVASPYPSKWEREEFIGATDTHYYTYLTKRYLPGSYYMYTDSTFLLKIQIQGDKTIESNIVRVVNHIDETSYGDWIHSEKIAPIFNVDEYLSKEGVYRAFPGNDLFYDFNLSLADNELSINDENRFVMLDSVSLQGFLKIDWEEIDFGVHYLLRVSSYFKVKEKYYFVIQYGHGGDMDFFQDIITMDADKVKAAIKMARKKK